MNLQYAKQIGFLVSLCVIALLAPAWGQPIDRIKMFDSCQRIIESGKYFRAYDNWKIKQFRISNTVYSETGKANINLILDEIEKRYENPDKRQVAYVLGTAYRETGRTLRPIHEVRRCESEACIHRNVGAYGQKMENGKSYYGRGFSQLTGVKNYQRFGSLLKLQPTSSLYDNPEIALEPNIAASIIVIGMFDGAFTGRYKLNDFFNSKKSDWVGARKIVNPESDRAPVTAGYAKLFYECMTGQSLIKNGELIR